MNAKFDKIVEKLGWSRLENLFLFLKEGSEVSTVSFLTDKSYEIENLNDERIDETFVQNLIYKIGSCNKFENHNKNWVVPLLISDYYAHRCDFKNELIWAKKAMKENNKLTPNQFSLNIREQL